MSKTVHRLEIENHKEFLLAGKAFVTFLNTLTGNRFTYRIIKGEKKDVHFVSVLYGCNNEKNYAYVGTIFNGSVFRHTKKSRVSKTSTRFKVFEYVFNHILKGTIPNYIEVWHDGRCGRCGKALTVPESIRSGFGPSCIKKSNQKKINYERV